MRSFRSTVPWLALTFLGSLYVARNVVIAGALLSDTTGDFANFFRAAQALLAHQSPFTVHNFDYPPLAAIVVLPIAGFEYQAARLIWFWSGHIAIVVSAWLMWRRLGHSLQSVVVVAAVWCLAGTVGENLVLGQFNPLLLLLVCVSIVGSDRRGAIDGVWLGLAAAVKLWPAVLMCGWAVRRRWRTLAVGGATAVLGVLVPLAVIALRLPPPHFPTSSGYWAGTPAPLNMSLPATAVRLVDLPVDDGELPRSWRLGNNPRRFELDGSAAVLSVVVSVIVLGLGTVWVISAGRRIGADTLPVLAALIAVVLAGAPISWYHYRLLHFPGLAWLAGAMVFSRKWLALLGVSAIGATLTWSQYAGIRVLRAAAYDPWFVLARGAVVPMLELVLAGWYLRIARVAGDRSDSVDG